MVEIVPEESHLDAYQPGKEVVILRASGGRRWVSGTTTAITDNVVQVQTAAGVAVESYIDVDGVLRPALNTIEEDGHRRDQAARTGRSACQPLTPHVPVDENPSPNSPRAEDLHQEEVPEALTNTVS